MPVNATTSKPIDKCKPKFFLPRRRYQRLDICNQIGTQDFMFGNTVLLYDRWPFPYRPLVVYFCHMPPRVD